MNSTKWLAPVVAGAVIAACAGGQAQPEAPAAEGAGAAESSSAEKGWKDMDREEQLEFMGLVVLPEMKKLFAEYDAEGYAEFKCQTCHGEDMKEVDYKMPNGLYGLPKAGTIDASKDYDPEITAFMMEKVVPKMAELLGQKPVEELSCFSCHDTEEE